MAYTPVESGIPPVDIEDAQSGLNPASALIADRIPANRCLSKRSVLFASLVGFVVACVLALTLRQRQHGIQSFDKSVPFEKKFYDSKDAYWQASERGISTSELWSNCKFPHMSTCDGYCCCEKGFYWKSPKTIYGQGKHIILTGVTAGERAGGDDDPEEAAKSAALGTAKALGHAALTAMISPDQKCIPRKQVPAKVLTELNKLHGGEAIPGSETWIACATFTPNTYSCGHYCCCDRGYTWNEVHETCGKGNVTSVQAVVKPDELKKPPAF